MGDLGAWSSAGTPFSEIPGVSSRLVTIRDHGNPHETSGGGHLPKRAFLGWVRSGTWQRWGLSESACVIAAEVWGIFSTSWGCPGSSEQGGVSLRVRSSMFFELVGTILLGPLLGRVWEGNGGFRADLVGFCSFLALWDHNLHVSGGGSARYQRFKLLHHPWSLSRFGRGCELNSAHILGGP